jgi:hypothetical protein
MVPTIVTVLLLVCGASSGSEINDESIKLIELTDLVTAPTIAPLSIDLPDPRGAPEDGLWKDHDGIPRLNGTFLPVPLDKEVFDRIDLLMRIPKIHQTQISNLKNWMEAECNGKLAVQESAYIAQQVKSTVELPPRGWSTVDMLLGIVGGIVIGGVGIAIYFLSK